MIELALPTASRSIYLISLLGAAADAIPSIAFPINSQVPPVARVLIPFTFTFSASTFSSASSLEYTLSNAPSWLSLDGPMRTLSGVPPTSAANTAPIIQITASDGSGSVTMNTTLVVSSYQAPVIVIPLEEQLNAFGSYSPPSSILKYPSSPFSFSFNPATFGQKILNYYAVSSDNTPLPAWVTFDGATLSFSGQTPNSSSLIQPPQTWGLQLIASDVVGFAGAAIKFNIVVGNHELKFKDELLSINAKIGMPIDYTNLASSLLLDGKDITISEIASIESTVPNWLTFDNTTFTLSGTPPLGATSFNVSITVVDTYQDIATAIIDVIISESIFVGSIGPLNATIGGQFSFNLSSSFLNTSDITVSAQTNPPATWLSFDSKTFILSGNIPSYIQPSTVQISLKASSKSTGLLEVQTFSLDVISASSQASSPTTAIPSPTKTLTPTDTSSTILPEATHTSRLSGGKIAAIVVAVILILSAMLFICLFCYKRKMHQERRRAALEKRNISRPVMSFSPNQKESQMDTRDGRVTSSNAYTNTTTYSRQPLSTLKRQSHSMSSLPSGVSMYLRDSRSSGTRDRSYSENALSDFGNSWRYTQDSAYPRIPVNDVRNSTSQATRNFSRKSGGPLPQEIGLSKPLAIGPKVTKEKTYEYRLSIQQTPEIAYNSEKMKKERSSRRRTLNYLGFHAVDRRLSGLGHGSHTGTSPSMGGPSWCSEEFSSVESGQTFDSQDYNLHRDESSWLKVPGGANVNEQRRQSALSVLTESTELLDSPRRKTIRQVPKSPNQPLSTRLSLTRGVSRRGSRRLVGSSPFFAGSSRTDSRGTSRRSLKSVRERYLYASSLPLEQRESANRALPDTITNILRDTESSSSDANDAFKEAISTDPLGITYESPGEGTRQLRDMVRRLSNYPNPSFRNSLHFSENDSRFQSAESSPRLSLYNKSEGQDGTQIFRSSQYGRTPEEESSPHSFNRDTYGVDGSPQLSQAMGAQTLRRPGVLLPAIGQSRLREANLLDEVAKGGYMPSSGIPASSIGRAMIREKSLAASQFETGSNGEVEVSLGSIHGAFL